MRNTDAQTLKADVFATADCKFELEPYDRPGSRGSPLTGAVSVNDDPTSECDENAQLLRKSDGTVRYRAQPSRHPSGINAQSVYNGATAG